MPDRSTILTRYNGTDQNPVDVSACSLEVTTVFRIRLSEPSQAASLHFFRESRIPRVRHDRDVLLLACLMMPETSRSAASVPEVHGPVAGRPR
jgi:hypothetical protein